jgi:hypothetical protein
MATLIHQLKSDIQRYVKRMGRDAHEQDVTLDRLAGDLGFRDFNHLLVAASTGRPGRFAQHLRSLLVELFDTPTSKPAGSDEFYEHWLSNCSPAALDLVTVAQRLGWSWCDPSINPFLFRTSHQWLERVRNTVLMLKPRFRSALPSESTLTNSTSVLDGNEFQIILGISESEVSAWVGRLGFGVGCEFNRHTLVPTGDATSPAYRTALGLAYAWYVDVSLPTVDGVPAMVNLAAEDWAAIQRYVPHPTEFRNWILECRGVSEPRLAHWVVAHIRHLTVSQPSDEKLATAPDHLRPFMGPHDTWVIGYARSGSHLDKLVKQLETRALVASAAGAGYWNN